MNLNRFANIASYLPDMAERQPETTAVYCPVGRFSADQHYQCYSYAQLEQESNRLAAALEQSGVERGMRTVLMVAPSLEFFALTFALFKLGAVPVLIDPGMGIKNLKTCLDEATPDVFIGMPKAHLARHLLRWARTASIRLTTGFRLWFDEISLRRELKKIPVDQGFVPIIPAPDETAAILFTSGSTGIPKGVVYTHAHFLAQVRSLKQIYQIEPGEIDLPTFPLFALFAPALGMTSVIPQMDFTRPGAVDPIRIITAIERFKVTTMFGSPALIRRIAEYGSVNKTRLPSLKRVISAGAPVAASTLARFKKLLSEEATIHTPYGATEALPVCSIESREILEQTRQLTDTGQGVCVGEPVPGVRLRMIPISDDPLPQFSVADLLKDGEIGEIIVCGEQVTRSYFGRPDSTQLAKTVQTETNDFFHRMGDLGYRDALGRIWFCGRKSHRVITAEETFYTIPCEAIFNTHPLVFRTALVAVAINGAIRPLICVELEDQVGHDQHAKILAELRHMAKTSPLTSDIKLFLIHSGFPVDIRHNAKIFREKLAIWAQQKVSR